MTARMLAVVGMALLLAGCQPPSERLDGPGDARLKPVVNGVETFADDYLSVPIEAKAATPQTEPRILEVNLYADDVRVPAPDLRIRRWQSKTLGFGQTAEFTAPLGARTLRASLFVHYLDRVYQMDVPFVLDPASREGVKWRMRPATVRMVSTTAVGRPAAPPPSPAPK